MARKLIMGSDGNPVSVEIDPSTGKPIPGTEMPVDINKPLEQNTISPVTGMDPQPYQDMAAFQRKIGVADDGLNGPKTKEAADKALKEKKITQEEYNRYYPSEQSTPTPETASASASATPEQPSSMTLDDQTKILSTNKYNPEFDLKFPNYAKPLLTADEADKYNKLYKEAVDTGNPLALEQVQEMYKSFINKDDEALAAEAKAAIDANKQRQSLSWLNALVGNPDQAAAADKSAYDANAYRISAGENAMNRINNAKTNALNMWKNQAEARRQLANDYITQQNNKAKADYDAQQDYFNNKMALAQNNRSMVINDVADRTQTVYSIDYIDKQIAAYENLKGTQDANGRAQTQKEIDNLKGQKSSLLSKLAILNRRIDTMSESSLMPKGVYMETPETPRGTVTADQAMFDLKKFQEKIGAAQDGLDGPGTRAAAEAALKAGTITKDEYAAYNKAYPEKVKTHPTKERFDYVAIENAYSGKHGTSAQGQYWNNERSKFETAVINGDPEAVAYMYDRHYEVGKGLLGQGKFEMLYNEANKQNKKGR